MQLLRGHIWTCMTPTVLTWHGCRGSHYGHFLHSGYRAWLSCRLAMLAMQQTITANRLGLLVHSRDVPRMQRAPALRWLPDAAALPSTRCLRSKLQAVVQQMPPAPGVEPLVMPDLADSSVVTGASLAFCYDTRIHKYPYKSFAEPSVALRNH